MSEHAEQVALFDWAKYHESRWPCLRWLHAIPNGGHRHKRVAQKMRAEGVKAGISDVFLPVAKRGYHGIYLEMKHGRNKPTDNQIAFMEFAKEQGYYVDVFWSWRDAAEVLEWYLGA